MGRESRGFGESRRLLGSRQAGLRRSAFAYLAPLGFEAVENVLGNGLLLRLRGLRVHHHEFSCQKADQNVLRRRWFHSVNEM